MDYISLLFGFIAGACGSLVLWITIGRRMMMKYAGKSVINAILDPNEDTKRAIEALFSHLWRSLNAQTMKKETTDKEGNKIEIKVSPLELIIEQIGVMLWTRMRGSWGAVKAEQGRVEQGLIQAMGGIPMPRKGQTTQDYVLEQIAARMMPVIEQKLSNWIDNRSRTSPNLPSKKVEGWD